MRCRDRMEWPGLFYVVVLCSLALLVTGCDSGQSALQGGPQPELAQPASKGWQLPGLPAAGLPGKVLSAAGYTLRQADQHAQQGASWQDLELSLAGAGFTYSILGRNVGDTPPTSIRMAGALAGVWLGVSDYGNNHWRWLGEYSADAIVSLPEGDYTNEDGMLYVALVCPDGSGTSQTTTLVFGDLLDTEPPVWQGGSGIESAVCDYYDGVISWYPAVDAESAPVEYLLYFARSEEGIDWDTPQFIVPGLITSTQFSLGTEEPTDFDFAVRARDAVGNLTDNTNYLTAFSTDGMALSIVPWVPGDRIVMSALGELADFGFDFWYLGPGEFLIGGVDDHWELEGLLGFSDDNLVSGLPEEWAELLQVSPLGSYTLEAQVSTWNSYTGETVRFQLLDAVGSVKQDFGYYTVAPYLMTGFDLAHLAHGSWPRDLAVVPGDTLEISWPDPLANLELCIEGPYYAWAGPSFPEDLAGEIEFSPDSEDSGVGLEWAKVLEAATPGAYHVSLQWWGYDGTPPDSLVVSLQLLDGVGALKVDLGSLELPAESGVDILSQLQYWPPE